MTILKLRYLEYKGKGIRAETDPETYEDGRLSSSHLMSYFVSCEFIDEELG